MKPNYQYPLFEEWNRDELVKVFKLYQLVEDAYELNSGTNCQSLLAAYNDFKKIIPAKGEQRTLEREFEHNSGYNIFKCVKAAQNSNRKMFKMNK
ncbi:UPF0223 family protein [Nicoliella spurrieriana]|uniref:UPF0223 family protein n=1 Tax=Nicoliella spurrieriana TaxID=2925830 RepID=A0A976X5A6_9LACO|nr:UPF0223 family protein [Nicoliella spurrieriana]UQS86461.1 UPF0223 family protein [Nicoliella spurrieriana]